MLVRVLRAVLACTLLLQGCSSGNSTAVSANLPFGAPRAVAAATVSIAIPEPRPASALARNAQFISPSTKSISIDPGNGPQNFNLVAGAPGCLSPPPPAIVEYPLAVGAQPRGIIAGPDGKMWIDEDSGAKLSTINLDGTGYTRFALNGARLNNSIAVGSDGYLYVGYVFGANNIGVYNKSGTWIADYVLPSPGITEQSVAIGYDGAMWYTEFGGSGKVGRVPVGGAGVTTFTPSSPANGITAGPDNAMWFTEPATGVIGRATSGGITNEFPGPPVAASARGIASGPDGALWIANIGTATIGRMTTAGVYTEFPLPSGSGAIALVAGPDGAMWFADYSGNNVGRITMAGGVTLYPIPSASTQTTSIALGPDNALWFTEQNGVDKVGRITIPLGVTCTLSLGVPVGNDVFTLKTYDQIGGSAGSGNVLASASATLAVTAAGPNMLSFSMNGVVSSVRVVAASSVISKGSAQIVPISVRALDAAGNTIIGSGGYVDQNGNPLTITLTDTDGSASTSLTTSTITSSSQVTSVNYNGSVGAVSATITPVVTGGTVPGGVTPLILTFM